MIQQLEFTAGDVDIQSYTKDGCVYEELNAENKQQIYDQEIKSDGYRLLHKWRILMQKKRNSKNKKYWH